MQEDSEISGDYYRVERAMIKANGKECKSYMQLYYDMQLMYDGMYIMMHGDSWYYTMYVGS